MVTVPPRSTHGRGVRRSTTAALACSCSFAVRNWNWIRNRNWFFNLCTLLYLVVQRVFHAGVRALTFEILPLLSIIVAVVCTGEWVEINPKKKVLCTFTGSTTSANRSGKVKRNCAS